MCIAVGSESGYKSKSDQVFEGGNNKAKKFGFLSAKRYNKSVKSWQKAILGDDISLHEKARCSKNFFEEEILFERIVKDSDRTLLEKYVYNLFINIYVYYCLFIMIFEIVIVNT